MRENIKKTLREKAYFSFLFNTSKGFSGTCTVLFCTFGYLI